MIEDEDVFDQGREANKIGRWSRCDQEKQEHKSYINRWRKDDGRRSYFTTNLPIKRGIDDPGWFTIADRNWLRQGSAKSNMDKAVAKSGMLLDLLPNPGYHIFLSVARGKCKKYGSSRMSKSHWPLIHCGIVVDAIERWRYARDGKTRDLYIDRRHWLTIDTIMR